MNRQLVTIQRIREVKTHPNADKLDLATVLGWQVVTKRDEFKVGDLCVFFEVDSILPELPVFEFMRNKHFRVRTVRFRKELSQGLAMPLSVISTIVGSTVAGVEFKEGQDVTAALGVKKHEIAIPMGSEAKGNFPHYVPKTDEIRVQTIVPDIFNEMDQRSVFATVKVDGTSSTFVVHDNELHVCSRNLEVKDGENVYWKMARKYNLANLPIDIAVQGEICGPGIQKNRLGLTEPDLFIFSVYDVVNRRYFDYDEYVRFTEGLGLKRVPLITAGFTFDKSIHTLEYLLEMAKGTYFGTNSDREGIVIRPMIESYSNILKGRMSFKVLNNDYLEKEE